MSNAASEKKWRDSQTAKGLCRSCTRPVKPGRRSCEYHLNKAKENTKKRQAAWMAQELCVGCGKRPPIQDRVHCAQCNARYQTLEHKTKRSEQSKIKAKKKKSAGLCVNCDQPASPNRTQCAYHLKQAGQYAKRRQDKLRAKGLCPYCGQPAAPDRKQCADCAKKHLASRRHNKFAGNWLPAVERDDWRCRICGDAKRIVVHHIGKHGNNYPLPNHDLDNLITLCWSCHGALTRFLNPERDTQLVVQLLLSAHS